MTFLSQEHSELARPIKRMRCVQLVDAMLERHLLRRWRNGLIVQTATTEREQFGLGTERKRFSLVLDQCPAFRVAQDGNFFFKKFTWVVKRPISA